MTTVMILAGGTGGHVFPALAVARQLRDQGVTVVWVGTRKGIEARLVPAAGFEMEWITIRGLRRTGLLSWLLLPVRLGVAMFQSWRIMRRRKPDVVLAMGGFVAAPGGLVASLLRRPLLIHEQNAVAGLTNRWLAYIADVVMCGFPETFGSHPGVRHVGNPVRPEILKLAPPAERLSARQGPLRVLVVGGSQGALVFNSVLPDAAANLSRSHVLEIWHQAGRSGCTSTERAYRKFSIEARVTIFIDDIAQAYDWADVLICRAGAMTIAEIAAAGLAAILVPYPHAVDDHQTANARYLADRDAAILVPQGEFDSSRLAELLAGLAANRGLLQKMAVNARACAVPDAAEAVSRLCLEAAHA